MGDFTEAETRALVAQHTEETGQPFSAAALDAVWTQTRGQPWLVNALCAGACFDNKAGRDRSRAIEADDVRAAREELILSRRTHLDQLAHKLEEARVRRVVEPILSGGEVQHDGRDLEYVRDLGLLAPDSPPRIANPIYASDTGRLASPPRRRPHQGDAHTIRRRYSGAQGGRSFCHRDTSSAQYSGVHQNGATPGRGFPAPPRRSADLGHRCGSGPYNRREGWGGGSAGRTGAAPLVVRCRAAAGAGRRRNEAEGWTRRRSSANPWSSTW